MNYSLNIKYTVPSGRYIKGSVDHFLSEMQFKNTRYLKGVI